MLIVPNPGKPARLCDSPTRRELLQAGGIGILGLSLPNFLKLSAAQAASQAPAAKAAGGKNGFGKAKSVIFLFLQGGPSHIDIWDPKPGAPANIRSQFKNIQTK